MFVINICLQSEFKINGKLKIAENTRILPPSGQSSYYGNSQNGKWVNGKKKPKKKQEIKQQQQMFFSLSLLFIFIL